MLKVHETNGWEILFKMELSMKLTIHIKNSLVTNVNEVGQYDLTYENCIQMKIYNNKKEALKCNLLKTKWWMYTIWTFFFRNEKIKWWTN